MKKKNKILSSLLCFLVLYSLVNISQNAIPHSPIDIGEGSDDYQNIVGFKI